MMASGRLTSRWVTVGALVGLATGLAAGIGIHASRSAELVQLATSLGVLGTLWTNALRMLVLPLVISNLVIGIAMIQDGRSVGRLGGLAVLIFAAMLAAAAAFAVLVTPPLLAHYSPAPSVVAALHSALPGVGPTAAATKMPTLADWLIGLIPSNVIRAAANDEILPVVLFTVLFALALTRIAPEPRRALLGWFQAVFQAVLVLLRWILAFSPIGVFALALALAARTGSGSVGVFGFWVVMVSGVMFAFTLLLYPVTALLGRVPLGRFAYALFPAQAVAIGTRSSLAALPALIEGAEQRLGLPALVAGFALPLAVSTFKVNRTISSAAKLLFLASLYRIHLDPGQIASFAVIVGILSFSTPGIPSAGTLATLPAYLAAGIPIEGVVLLNAVDAIPDIFKTLLNVTGDMSAAAILARITGAKTYVPAGARLRPDSAGAPAPEAPGA